MDLTKRLYTEYTNLAFLLAIITFITTSLLNYVISQAKFNAERGLHHACVPLVIELTVTRTYMQTNMGGALQNLELHCMLTFGHKYAILEYWVYSRLSLIRSPLGPCSLAGIARWPYFR